MKMMLLMIRKLKVGIYFSAIEADGGAAGGVGGGNSILTLYSHMYPCMAACLHACAYCLHMKRAVNVTLNLYA